MSVDWLFLDCDNLCWSIFYTPAGKLEKGIVYGFLRSLRWLLKEFSPAKPVFCFGSKNRKRREIYSEYKASFDTKLDECSDEDREALAIFSQQRSLLRTEYLSELGYVNVLQEKGYEADDL